MVQSKSTLDQNAREIRRNSVKTVMSAHPSYTVRQIEDKLNLSHGTVQRDITYWTKLSDNEMHYHFKTLPLKIMQGIELAEMTIEWLSNIIESDTIDLDHQMQASRDRLVASEYRDRLLDGKARLNEVTRKMDSIRQPYRTLDLTGLKPKVIGHRQEDGNNRTLSK